MRPIRCRLVLSYRALLLALVRTHLPALLITAIFGQTLRPFGSHSHPIQITLMGRFLDLTRRYTFPGRLRIVCPAAQRPHARSAQSASVIAHNIPPSLSCSTSISNLPLLAALYLHICIRSPPAKIAHRVLPLSCTGAPANRTFTTCGPAARPCLSRSESLVQPPRSSAQLSRRTATVLETRLHCSSLSLSLRVAPSRAPMTPRRPSVPLPHLPPRLFVSPAAPARPPPSP